MLACTRTSRDTTESSLLRGFKEDVMCLSNVYKDKLEDANLLARNVADIKFQEGKIFFTDILGVRTVFDGHLDQIDLTENYIIVKE